MTRYWPMAMVQIPTAVYMVSGFMNSFRTIFLDGRAAHRRDIAIRTANGESIGHWEGDTLVVDTTISATITTGWIRAACRFPPASSCTSSSASGC